MKERATMSPQTLDSIAIGLALGAIILRLTDRPWWSSILGSCSLLASVCAQAASRRKQARPG